MFNPMDMSSGSEDDAGDIFAGIKIPTHPSPNIVPPFVGSDSSSSGDEMERRLSAPQFISGKGRSREQEETLATERAAAMKRLDEEELMAEMDQEDLEAEDGIEEARAVVDEKELVRQWKQVEQMRREPSLTEKEASDIKPRRAGWKDSPAKKKTRKKRSSASAKKRKAAAEGEDGEPVTPTPPASKKGRRRRKKSPDSPTEKEAQPSPLTASEKASVTQQLAMAAAAEFESFASGTTMDTSRGSAGRSIRGPPVAKSSSHPVMRYLGDFSRACLVTMMWGGKDKPNPPEEDLQMVSIVLPNANLFMEAGKELGDRIVESCQAIFSHANNKTLEIILKAVCEVTELHVQPTVRKAPTDDTVDVWSGDVLSKEMLNTMSSLVFNPKEGNRMPSSVLISKQPATMFSLIHFLMHFGDYCKKTAHMGLMEVQGKIAPDMNFKQAWAACIGEALAKQNFMKWPKSGRSTTGFSTAIVKMREWVNACIWLDQFLESELERIAADEGGDDDDDMDVEEEEEEEEEDNSPESD